MKAPQPNLFVRSRRGIAGRLALGLGASALSLCLSGVSAGAAVVDPSLEWATYLGGTGEDRVLAMTRTEEGNIVLAGTTESASFPTTVGPPHAGALDAFVAILDPTGSTLLASTLLGGAGQDVAHDVKVGADGSVYVVGLTGSLTTSPPFPTTAGSWQPSTGGGNWDGFVVELSPDLGTLTYASFLGGGDWDCAGTLHLRAPRVLTIAGSTRSTDFPAITPATAVQPANAGGNCDYFLCRLDLDQPSPLLYGSYLGGSAGDGVTMGNLYQTFKDPQIHEDASGVVTLAGRTTSNDIVRTLAGYDSSFNSPGFWDAYVAVVDPSMPGSAGLVYDTYLGADLSDAVRALDVDAAGVITVGGWTDSPAFPTTPGALGTTFIGPNPAHDGFVARLDPSLLPAQQLVYSTLLSGDGYENVTDLVLDSSGRILAQGYTGDVGLTSNSFPTTPCAFQTVFGERHDGFLVHIDPAGNGMEDLVYSTFLGEVGWDVLSFGLEILSESPKLRVVCAGGSGVFGFPTTPGAYQPNPAGVGDVVVVQMELEVCIGDSFCFGVGCPCGNGSASSGCVNSTGSGALLTAWGSTSVAADDLVLRTTGCPPNNTGLYFMGGTTFAPVFVGDGLACTGGIWRYFPGIVDSSGVFCQTTPVAGAFAGAINIGDTRHFQSWTRDVLCGPPPSPCPSPCGNNSNLSNGLSIVFTP